MPFWENPDLEGEQLSLFGDSEPLTASNTEKEKSKSEFSKGPVVDGVQVYEALAAEIDRGTGFVHGKLRVQDFFEEEQSAPVKSQPAVNPEAEKPEIPTVKNLSQLKKAIKPGMMFEITDHLRPECIGERRIVTGVSTVDFTSRKLDENGKPMGKDLHMDFDRAKNWAFDGGELTSRLDNGDMLMSFHFIDKQQIFRQVGACYSEVWHSQNERL